MGIKKREREKENDRKQELLSDIDDVKRKVDHYNRLIGNEEAIRLEVEEKVEEEIAELQRQIHETDRKIIDRKEEIDKTDSNIDHLSE